MSAAELFSLPFMQRALLAALFTGLAAPAIGTYLVQRRLALMGDGIGHVAVTGVALGLLTGASPTWTAVIVAIAGAVLIEVIRERGHANGDVALALLFYGGLAGGVLITGLAGKSGAVLQRYLFGSITTTSRTDVIVVMVLADTLETMSGRGSTIVLVAHELGPMASLIDRAVVMRDGRVAYDGPPLASAEVATAHLDGHHHHHHSEPQRHDHAPHVSSPIERPLETER